MLVAGGAANSVIIFHAESVKVPVNCTLTSASELEAALPKELLPISALGKRIHHCRPRETAKSFPELPAAKSPCSPLFLSSLSLFSSLRRGSEGRCQIVSVLWGWQEQVGSCSGGSTERPWVCVPTPAGQCCGPSPWRFSTCTSWAWEMCPKSWRGHPGISSVPGALQPPLGADKGVWVRPPPLSPVLAPRCFHPPHQGGQGAPWGLRQHLTWTPTPGTSPAHPRAERSLPWV